METSVDVDRVATNGTSQLTLDDALEGLAVSAECRACLERLQAGPTENVDIARCVCASASVTVSAAKSVV